MRGLTTLASALILALASTASAQARPGTASETAAVAALYGFAPECTALVVSDRDPTYARLDFVPSVSCEQTSNGFGIARRNSTGRYVDVYQASESSEACPAVDIPTNVGLELKACSRPSKHTYLSTFRGLQDRPARLDYGTRNQLLRLRWKQWGKSTATATGTFFYNDANPGVAFRIPVRVTVSKRTYCGAKRTYLRFKVSAVRRRDRSKIAGFATGAQTYDCTGGQVLE